MELAAKIAFIITLVALFLSSLLVLFFGFIPHYKRYQTPYLQFPSLLLLTLYLFLQITFFLGGIFLQHYSAIELLTALIISAICVVFFFQALMRILTLEALNLCYLSKEEETKNKEDALYDLEQESMVSLQNTIKESGLSNLGSLKFQRQCICLIFMKIRRFRHVKFLRCILGEFICTDLKTARGYWRRHQWITILYCVFMPLIFLCLEILRHYDVKQNGPMIVLTILKCIFTFLFMYDITCLIENIRAFLPQCHLLGRLNCVRTIIILNLIQNVIISAIDATGTLGSSLNWVILAVENLLLGYFWLTYYGAKSCSLERFKGLEGKFGKVFREEMSKEKEPLLT